VQQVEDYEVVEAVLVVEAVEAEPLVRARQ
jgi:hypothetical protein